MTVPSFAATLEVGDAHPEHGNLRVFTVTSLASKVNSYASIFYNQAETGTNTLLLEPIKQSAVNVGIIDSTNGNFQVEVRASLFNAFSLKSNPARVRIRVVGNLDFQTGDTRLVFAGMGWDKCTHCS